MGTQRPSHTPGRGGLSPGAWRPAPVPAWAALEAASLSGEASSCLSSRPAAPPCTPGSSWALPWFRSPSRLRSRSSSASAVHAASFAAGPAQVSEDPSPPVSLEMSAAAPGWPALPQEAAPQLESASTHLLGREDKLKISPCTTGRGQHGYSLWAGMTPRAGLGFSSCVFLKGIKRGLNSRTLGQCTWHAPWGLGMGC